VPTSASDAAAAPGGPAVLTAEGLEVRYGKVVAASDVSLHVNRGEIVALLGPNGAGKTSVLRAIGGLLPLSRGSVALFDGAAWRRVEGKPPHVLARLGVAIVPAQHVVLPRMTVAENLEVGGRFLVADRHALKRAVASMLERFPALGARRTQYAGSLSGGEQRQLAIARALVRQPRLMLLDEPSLGLSPIALSEIFGLLTQINRDHAVDILLVEQNVMKALEIAHRAYVMRVGAMDFSGPSAEVAKSDKLALAYLGS
jgi:branched-chain amino acid transport system ATP-binding protein